MNILKTLEGMTMRVEAINRGLKAWNEESDTPGSRTWEWRLLICFVIALSGIIYFMIKVG